MVLFGSKPTLIHVTILNILCKLAHVLVRNTELLSVCTCTTCTCTYILVPVPNSRRVLLILRCLIVVVLMDFDLPAKFWIAHTNSSIKVKLE